MTRLFMSEQEIKTLMTLAQKDPRDYAMLRLMASTGFRVSDIVRLRREDLIDSDGEIVRVLRIKMEKTDKWVPDGHPKSPTCGRVKIPHLTA